VREVKIPLKFENGLLYLYCTVQSQRKIAFIRAIIDTGSPETIISEGDTLKLQVSVKHLKPDKHGYGLGGSSVPLYKLGNMDSNLKQKMTN